MGNEACLAVCREHDGEGVMLSDINHENDKPKGDFATYIGKETYGIACDASHVLHTFEKESKQVGLENLQSGNYIGEGYYRIHQFKVDYCGEWRKGLPHGKGQVIFQDGSVFVGSFRDGIGHGADCLHIANTGAYYRGQIKNNKREGKGVFVDGQYKYQGEWANNYPNGFGKETFANGDTFEGEYVDGEKEGKKGKYIWHHHPEFLSYEGAVKNNYMFSLGQLITRKSVIVGDFQFTMGNERISNAKINTLGISFEGDIVQGKVTGSFVQILKKQKGQQVVVKGSVKDSQLHGILAVQQQDQRLGNLKQQKFFESKLLREYQNLSDEQIRQLLATIESSYSSVSTHSAALANMSKQMGKYSFKLIQTTQQLPKKQTPILAVDICGKTVLAQRLRQSVK